VYQEIKNIITSILPLTHDALHILIGMGVYLALCLVFRRPIGWRWAFVVVLAMAIGAEVMDMQDDFKVYGRWIWRESMKDILLTISVPLALWVYTRLAR
jgi:hypothetical protein